MTKSHHLLYLIIVAACICCVPGCLPEKTIIATTPQEAPPVKTAAPTLLPPKKEAPNLQKVVTATSARTHIQYKGVQSDPQHRLVVENCLRFLVNEFGAPLFPGDVTLTITASSKDNGRMTWSDARDDHRSIFLYHVNLIESEQRVLVHELFHAFYQTTEFIKAMPEFITEGFAVYAENLFRYRERKTPAQIKDSLQRQALSLYEDADRVQIDFDIPFALYKGTMQDVMYLQAGRFIFSQAAARNGKNILRDMLAISTKGQRLSFFEIVDLYHLATTEAFLHPYTAG